VKPRLAIMARRGFFHFQCDHHDYGPSMYYDKNDNIWSYRFLEEPSSKEWKLNKFLETLESRCLKWEETILESLEKEGFKTFFESLERGCFERGESSWKESLCANGFCFLMLLICSRQVQCSPHIAMVVQRQEEKQSTVDYQMPALKMMTNSMKSTIVKATTRFPPER
jgi:hypothetical protein